MLTSTSASLGLKRFLFWAASLGRTVSVRIQRRCVPLHSGRCLSRRRICVNGSAWPTTCTSIAPITLRWHGL
ncbi:hypothetical protein PF006_g29220 [Phytophthora fragariae]|uniref:Uncharacterized protein n=1 Tax=Phytophthora fragariae TaxID=53985 RepID=A0A6A3Q9N4_9STRA|nr:hypothetical protein PF006_g29220 [Phytophthora fragariae]